MTRAGKYLNELERFVIEVELADGNTISGIARKLGRARCTIQREIARGSCEQIDSRFLTINLVYKADYAQMMSIRRSSAKGCALKIGKDMASARQLEILIKNNHWSPAAALGYAKRKKLISTVVSVPTLYSYIKNGVLSINEDDLPRRGLQKRRAARRYRQSHRNLRGKSIEERPKKVLDRKEWGHWEGDLIVGSSNTKVSYLTLLERKTRYVIAMRVNSRKKYETPHCLDALERYFGETFSNVFKTITFDNGSEFSDWESMERSCLKNEKRTHIYYAHPYCSSERGSNENCNGLLRRAGFKKSSNLGSIKPEEAAKFISWVNSLPRRILGFQSALEAFIKDYRSVYGVTKISSFQEVPQLYATG